MALGTPRALAREAAMNAARKALDWDGMARAALDPSQVEQLSSLPPYLTLLQYNTYCSATAKALQRHCRSTAQLSETMSNITITCTTKEKLVQGLMPIRKYTLRPPLVCPQWLNTEL